MLKTLAAVSALTLLPLAAHAADLPTYPFVHVSGTGTLTALPDTGQIDFEIVASDADPALAVGVVEARAADIRAVMTQAGVPLDDVEIRDVRKDFRKPDANTPVGLVIYDIRAGVRINVRDLTKWRAAAAPLLAMPNLDGFMTVFDTTEREKIEMALAADAIGIARRKAEGIAAGLGRKLGPATAVSTGDLKNLTRAMGLAPADNNYREGRRAGMDRADVLAVISLKFAQPVDVIYRLK